MAKRRSNHGDDVAAQIAAFIGKAMGGLANRKDALQRELADVERQMSAVRDRVVKQLGAREIPFPKSGRDVRKAAATATKTVRKAMSDETRAKMAEAAKKRWAAAKKAGKTRLG